MKAFLMILKGPEVAMPLRAYPNQRHGHAEHQAWFNMQCFVCSPTHQWISYNIMYIHLDMLPCSEREGQHACDPDILKHTVQHSSDPQIIKYSVVDKSKGTKEHTVPVFEVLYDQSAAAGKDDIDTPINLTVS